jgi:hypothetical protein
VTQTDQITTTVPENETVSEEIVPKTEDGRLIGVTVDGNDVTLQMRTASGVNVAAHFTPFRASQHLEVAMHGRCEPSFLADKKGRLTLSGLTGRMWPDTVATSNAAAIDETPIICVMPSAGKLTVGVHLLTVGAVTFSTFETGVVSEVLAWIALYDPNAPIYQVIYNPETLDGIAVGLSGYGAITPETAVDPVDPVDPE